MGKKQTRQNRGARTGGHEHRATAETKEQPKAPVTREVKPSTPEVAHKQPRKFGHN
ncbi:hypothetical protein [Streptomyces albireticuli]|uniref:hypothetical protein n=1 Tax=Streptomyces albireticuli TaxID=1940 RepID=UPI001476151F|nr:hypothetical protein [Streptomyces albireticuli]MCD9194670.1 hypothetical protein [Streptomyces albireticuli]